MSSRKSGTSSSANRASTNLLDDLLDKAVATSQQMHEGPTDVPEETDRAFLLTENPSVIGCNAVRYFELSHNRLSDYQFSGKLSAAMPCVTSSCRTTVSATTSFLLNMPPV